MKKVLLIAFLAYFSTLGLFAQSIQISVGGNNLNNGDTLVFFSTDTLVSFMVPAEVKNVSTNSISIKVKKTELSIVSGSENYFCWSQCYVPSIFVSPDSIVFSTGSTNTNFSGDYSSKGHRGASYIMYTFFDMYNTNDSIAFVAKYIAGSGVGIENSQAKAKVSNIYPNPARNTISLNYDLNGTQYAQLEIHNILGSLVKTIEIDETSGFLNIDVTDLNNGVYFYSFIVNNKVITSKKLVIQR